MIKSFTLVISLLVITFLSLPKDNYIEFNPFKIPSGDGDISPKERDEYFSRLLADPKTGEIPIESIIASKRFIKESFLQNRSKNKTGLLSDYSWKVRGPYQIGGRVRALAYDVRNENRILAAGASGGLWLSTDAGANWKKVTSPTDNHSVSCIVQDTREGKEDTWYYGTGERIASKHRYGYGMYKSTDNGNTWKVVDGTVTSNKKGGWDNPFDFIFRIVLDPKAKSDEDIILAATANGGIQRSSDGGNTWKAVFSGNNTSLYNEVSVTKSGIFYATLSKYSNSGAYNSTIHGIYRSENGTDWTRINPSNYAENYSRIVLGINPSNENEVYFFADTDKSGKQTFNHAGDELWHSLFKYTYVSGNGSADGGTWEDLSENLPKPELNRQQTNSQGGYNMVIKVHPTDPNTVIIGDVNVWLSRDGFTSSDKLNLIGGTCKGDDNSCDYHYRYPNHHSDVHELIFLKSDPNVMLTGTDGGVHKTLDLFADYVEWISLNNGFYTTQFYDIGIPTASNGNYNIVGGMQDNGTLVTNVNESNHIWTDVLRGDGFNCEYANDGSFIITSKNSTPQPKINIWKTELDAQGNAVKTRRIDPIGGRDFSWNTPFALDPNSNDLLYVAGGGILWRQSQLTEIELTDSKDSISQGWDSLTHTFVDEYNWDVPRSGEIISAVSVSTVPANIVFYGTTKGKIYKIENANLGNPTPIEITKPGMSKGSNINCIAVNPKDADEIICVYSSYNTKSIFRTTDGGDNWEDISGSLEEYADGSGGGPAVQWVEIMPLEDEFIYLAGTSDGLFVTSYINGNSTPWQLEAIETIGTAWVSSIKSRASDNYVAVGTYSQGVYDAFISSKPTKASPPTILTQTYVDAFDTLTISWEKGTNTAFYQLEVSDSPDFSNIIKTLFEKGTSTRLSNLEQGYKKYYVRISAVNAGGIGEHSETIDITTFLNAPNAIFPPDNQEDLPYGLAVTWDKIETATAYHFQLNYFNKFENSIIDTVVNQNSIYVNLSQNRTFRWRVQAIKDDKYGIFSDIFKFKTGTQASVREAKSNELNIYPNPAKDYINLDIINNKNFNYYTINNVSGKNIIFKSKFKEKINISNLNNGVYFLILENNNEKIYKKFIVSK
jgi:photosystem II stability/assembly factor-like uncharacterized protein